MRAIDSALVTREHHPTLFGTFLYEDRDCRQLARAVARYKIRQPAAGSRTDRDEVERVDLEWEERHARKREERFAKDKLQIDTARRDGRRRMTPFELHRHAVERLAKISTVAAGNVEPSRGGDERVGPPKQQRIEDDPRWQEHEFIVRRRLELMHQLLDEAEGLGSQAARTLTREEKNRMVLTQGRGYTCEVVVDLLGREIAGSVRTVWRIRKNTQSIDSEEYRILGFAVSTIDGEPTADRPQPALRRVVIES